MIVTLLKRLVLPRIYMPLPHMFSKKNPINFSFFALLMHIRGLLVKIFRYTPGIYACVTTTPPPPHPQGEITARHSICTFVLEFS